MQLLFRTQVPRRAEAVFQLKEILFAAFGELLRQYSPLSSLKTSVVDQLESHRGEEDAVGGVQIISEPWMTRWT